MYLNSQNQSLQQQIDSMDRKKVKSMEGGRYGFDIVPKPMGMSDLGIVPFFSEQFERPIGGAKKKRGRKPKSAKLEGEGILGSIGGLVDNMFGLGEPKKGMRKYKKQSEEKYTPGSSGFSSGTHMDTGFDRTEGAGVSGGAKLTSEQIEKLMKVLFSSGKAKKFKQHLEGGNFWDDFASGFKEGFTGTLDMASHVIPFLGLGKGKKSCSCEKVVEKHQMRGSDMAGGRKVPSGNFAYGIDVVGKGRSGGGPSGGGGSGGKKPLNAWLQLVNKVRKEKGFKGVKQAIAYIKEHDLYKK